MHKEKEALPPSLPNEDIWREKRLAMVDRQIRARGVQDSCLLAVMESVPRHLFVPAGERHLAYDDHPLPIGYEQTISQPFIVAYMTAMLGIGPDDKVLEIGTGSGYQTAVLASLCRRVWTIERIRPLAMQARKVLDALHLLNVNIKVGDGTLGWPEEAPFDAILVTAGAPAVPEALAQQLAPGGRLVIPVGDAANQTILRIRKQADGSLTSETGVGCRFVPLIGQQGWQTAA